MSTRPPRIDLARALVLALLAGHSRAEIAIMLGVSRTTVTRLARHCGARLPHGNAPRIVGARVHKGELGRLDVLAGQAGVSRQVMASRILRAALSAGPGGPERLLGREARPRRPYGRKTDGEADRTTDCRYASIIGHGAAFGEAIALEAAA